MRRAPLCLAFALFWTCPAVAAEEGVLVQVPDLRIVGWAVDDTDALGGNGDGGLHPGETALLAIFLSNQGNETARGVAGQLFEVGDHPDVEILDKLALWPDLPGTGAPAVSSFPHFEIRVAVTRPCRWEIPLRLELTADGGYYETREFTLEMVDPQRVDLATRAGRPFVFGADPSDFFAGALATGDLDGDGFDDLVAGWDGADGPANGRAGAGAVTVIYGGPARRTDLDLILSPSGVAVIHGADASDALGGSVATGDVDGDGFDDLVIGASTADGPANGRGSGGDVAVIWGGPVRLTTVDLASPPAGTSFVYGADAADFLGTSVATGDVNADGFDDLVLGALFADGPGNARSGAGDVAVVYGGPSRPSTIDLAAPPASVAIVRGEGTGDGLGAAVATGDVDGDGFDDLVLGADAADGPANARSAAGAAVVVFGGSARLADVDLATAPPGVTILHGAGGADLLGRPVATGDLDGDGFDDLVLGALGGKGPSNARSSAGEVVVVWGDPVRLPEIDLALSTPGAFVVYGADASDFLGRSVATGDLDGDGFDDLLIGADFADGPANGRSGAGEVVALHGGPLRRSDVDLATPPPDVTILFGADPSDAFGRGVGTVDLDGDGFDDLVAGAFGDGPTNVRPDAGEVVVIPGAPRSRYRHDPAAFAFIDATTGANLGLGCDDCGVTLPIGFDFDFFGRKVTEVTVSSNGYLTFGGPGDRLPAFCPPRSGLPNGVIAPFWEDLDPSAGGAVYALLQGTAPNRRLTVEWAGVPLFGGAGDATFEVTLFESSDRIVMQYLDVTLGGIADGGGTAIVGVENATGRNGAPFSCFAPSVANGSARAWRRFASPTRIFSHDAEAGTGSFTATGLWHRESSCAPTARSGAFSWYYGKADGSCTFDTGVTHAGTLTSPTIPDLPQDARLSLWQRRQTEGASGFDVSRVEAQGDGGGFGLLADVQDESNAWRWTEDFLPPSPASAIFSSLDLSAHAGRDVQVRFSFDTIDAINNAFLGWMVDDITIHACPVFSAAPEAGTAVEARATAHPPVICEDAGSRLDAVGSYCAACPVPLTYQWAEEGSPIPGATGVTLDLPPGHAPGTFDFTVAVACPSTAACAAESEPAEIRVVARPQVVGPTLALTSDGSSLTFRWTDVSGAADYVVLSGTDPSAPLAASVGSASSGSPGLTTALPPGNLVFFRVAGRNPTCGLGPQG